MGLGTLSGTRRSIVSVCSRKNYGKCISASAGQYHILIVKSDNTLWGLGWNDYGQLGQSEQEKYVEPIKIMEDVKHAVAGADHSIILKTNGGVVTFGNRVNWE